MAETIRVGTLNLRNIDRWNDRLPLLVEQMVELAPDVIGLQEVRPLFRQATRLTEKVNDQMGGSTYTLELARKIGCRGLWEAIAVMTRLSVLDRGRLDLRGGSRIAQRLRLRLPSGSHLDFYNTHLHHKRKDDELRTRQARSITEWLALHAGAPQVVVGDFNADPSSDAIAVMTQDLRSAHVVVHGKEPEFTSPAPFGRSFGKEKGRVIDFIFVNDLVEVRDARVTFNVAHPDNPRLTPSDHFGLAADIAIQEP
jgi:endonuclease/exonuclease/phosphatase family metal-dependent hydrolase